MISAKKLQRSFWVFLFTGCSASIALAQAYSATYDDSARIRLLDYKSNLVVRVEGYQDHPILIELPPDEGITDVAGGGIAGWEVVKNGHRMFIRPLADAKPATVLATSKTRSYVLDLVPVFRTAGKGSNYEVRVSKIVVSMPRPAPEIKRAPEPVVLPLPATEKPPVLPKVRNDQYSLEVVYETDDVRPTEVYDDGRFTYFKYPENMPIPAIYRSTPGVEAEWLVNSHREGDYVVLHAISPLWNVRYPGTVLGIFNDAFDASGEGPKHGTTVEGLRRIVK